MFFYRKKDAYCRSIFRVQAILIEIAHCRHLSLVGELSRFFQKKFSNFLALVLALADSKMRSPPRLACVHLDVLGWANVQKFRILSNPGPIL